jgi:hypothetical protein
MPRPVPVLVQTYRGHRLFVLDDGGAGWSVLVEGGHAAPALTLEDDRPSSLPDLLTALRRHVDRALDERVAEGVPAAH